MWAGSIQRIVLITDFGDGLYIGQMRARLGARLPAIPLIDLVHDLPSFRPDLAGYLLPALVRDMPAGTLYLCVVDPGVGSARSGLLLKAEDNWFIGPDNGLFAPLMRRTGSLAAWRVGWQPLKMSASFHGRDWFAPAAVRLCLGEDLELVSVTPDRLVGSDWPRSLSSILYADRFGNLISGLDAPQDDLAYELQVGSQRLSRARTFSDVALGAAFWFEDAFGLIEIAVNQGRADQCFGLEPGDPIGPLILAC